MKRCCVEAQYDLDFAVEEFEEMIRDLPDAKLRDFAPLAFRQAMVHQLGRKEIKARKKTLRYRLRAWFGRSEP